jgi:OHCU decarboxylase
MTLDQLNELSAEQAKAELLKCCGSKAWATKMCAARPFADNASLTAAADAVCESLNEEDWLEAFRAHPKIGERKAATDQSRQAQSWSAEEQSGVANAASKTVHELAQKNRDYEARFGFIFIVCATGKSPEEMLSILQSRISNDRQDELLIAAEEQRQITRLRLEKLLSQ